MSPPTPAQANAIDQCIQQISDVVQRSTGVRMARPLWLVDTLERLCDDYAALPGLVGHKAEQHTAQAVPPSTLQEALEQRDRARSLACRLEEELALIRRAATTRRHG